MKNKAFIYFLSLAIVTVLLSCQPEDIPPPNDPNNQLPSHLNQDLTYGSVTDASGNSYATIQIGAQTWMAENLRTGKYCNGQDITNITASSQWSQITGEDFGGLSTPAFSSYNNNPQNDYPYGRLYNWFAVDDSRNICPCGWHVPSIEEWITLVNFLGHFSYSGEKMKSQATGHWAGNLGNVTGDNSSGFSALPNSWRITGTGQFYIHNASAFYWSSSQHELNNLLLSKTIQIYGDINMTPEPGVLGADATDPKWQAPGNGLAIRCIKD